MWATNGFPEILPLPALLPARGVYSDVEPSRATFRYLSVDVFLSPSLILDLPSPLCLLPLVLSYSGGFSASRLVCTLFTIHRNLLIASFLAGGKGRAVSFLVEEISGLDHAIDFHASPVLVFLSLSPSHRLSRLSGSQTI